VQNKLGISEKELSEIVTRLDMSDGDINGKKANKVEICSHCGCVMSNTFKKCLICGEPAKNFSEVDTI
jgi:rubrerythrin